MDIELSSTRDGVTAYQNQPESLSDVSLIATISSIQLAFDELSAPLLRQHKASCQYSALIQNQAYRRYRSSVDVSRS